MTVFFFTLFRFFRQISIWAGVCLSLTVLLGEEPPAEPAASDPFYRSFNEAFSEVLAETAPELSFSAAEKEKKTDPASSALLSAIKTESQDFLAEALPAAAAVEYLPGAKARRSFIFAKGDGEYCCLKTGGDFDMTPGEFLYTGRRLDAAVAGEGFFQLKRVSDGLLFYTKAGNFSADSEGYLFLERESVIYQLEPPVKDVCEIESLYRFSNPAFLMSDDSVFFQPTLRSGEPVPLSPRGREGNSSLLSEYLEGSNARTSLILNEMKRLNAE